MVLKVNIYIYLYLFIKELAPFFDKSIQILHDLQGFQKLLNGVKMQLLWTFY